ncbi:unnamed protein product [Linum trigynum]|uniref:Uncharacterized protein n=1 Tax=Linum trigynum TaxID=586398 RepID=A0AAV2CGV8_9ROSI
MSLAVGRPHEAPNLLSKSNTTTARLAPRTMVAAGVRVEVEAESGAEVHDEVPDHFPGPDVRVVKRFKGHSPNTSGMWPDRLATYLCRLSGRRRHTSLAVGRPHTRLQIF